MVRYPFIAIEGVIGVGKTTLARLIRDSFEAELLLEVFEENPFLSDFYADRERYAFQTQIFFLLSRYRQQYRVIGPTLSHSALISDYSFAKDRLFAYLNLAGDELEMYERVHNVLAEKIPMPDLIVYFGDLNWRLAGMVGIGSLHLRENDTGPDDANHLPDGVFAWDPAGSGTPRPAERYEIYDIAPTVLRFFGLEVPDDMIGKPII